jgi:hypothetical protein
MMRILTALLVVTELSTGLPALADGVDSGSTTAAQVAPANASDAVASPEAESNTAAPPTETTAPTKSSDGPLLKATVQLNKLSMKEQVQEMRKSCKQLQKATLFMLSETHRQGYAMARGPNVIGGPIGPVVMPAAPTVTGEVACGKLAPRPAWLDFLLVDINKKVRNLHENALALNANMDKIQDEDMKQEWRHVCKLTTDIINNYMALEASAGQKPYKIRWIDRCSMTIYQRAMQLDKPCQHIYSQIKGIPAK